MADLYSSVAGTVQKTAVSAQGFVTISGLESLFKGGQLLLTSVRADRSQQVQTIKTLSNNYYIYAFGEAPGKITVGGLIFFGNCGGGASTPIGDLNKAFNQTNVYSKGAATQMVIGNNSYRVLLTGLSVIADMNQFNYGSFALSFTFLPF